MIFPDCFGLIMIRWVSETYIPKRQPVQGAGKHNKPYIHFTFTNLQWMKKIAQLIHPIKNVPGTLLPMIVPAKLLNHRVPSLSRAANSSSVFREPSQCSHNPSLSWQVGNIVSKFPVLPEAHGRPRWHSMTSCEKAFVPEMQDFMPRQRPMHVTRWPTNGTQQRNTISILHRSCLYTFLWAASRQATRVTMALSNLKRSCIATFLFTKYGLFGGREREREREKKKNVFDAAWRWCAKSKVWLPWSVAISAAPSRESADVARRQDMSGTDQANLYIIEGT